MFHDRSEAIGLSSLLEKRPISLHYQNCNPVTKSAGAKMEKLNRHLGLDLEPPRPNPPRKKLLRPVAGVHGLIRDAKGHYDAGYKVDEGHHLRPYKGCWSTSLHHWPDWIRGSALQMIYSMHWSPPATVSLSLLQPKSSRVPISTITSNCPKYIAMSVRMTTTAYGRHSVPP